jgi:hypothetical protein
MTVLAFYGWAIKTPALVGRFPSRLDADAGYGTVSKATLRDISARL